MTSTTRLVILIGVALIATSIIMLLVGVPAHETDIVVGWVLVSAGLWNALLDTLKDEED